MKKLTHFTSVIALTLFLFVGLSTFAYTITSTNSEVRGDFVVEPGKTEIFVDPGQKQIKKISVTNRSGEEQNFSITIEDIVGTESEDSAVHLLGDDIGPFSLRDIVFPEIRNFSLKPGEKMTFDVVVDIPEGFSPGGYYGAIVIAKGVDELSLTEGAGTKVIPRIGSLFLIRVSGQVQEQGYLQEIELINGQKIMTKSPKGFQLIFKNTGNVHLVPYGYIQIENIFGQSVAELPVNAYFALPQATRYKKIFWNEPGFLFGYYTATAEIYPGFGDGSNIQKVSFWVLPWKYLAGAVGLIIVLSFLVYLFLSRFELRKK